jgi:hypothetical protein
VAASWSASACGSLKIWNRHPSTGPTRAADAYIGPLFNKNKAYALKFGTAWMILSAKYGLVQPSFIIPRSYDVTFKRASTRPIALVDVARQAAEIDLAAYDVVVGLGGKDYCTIVAAAFHSVKTEFPFLGLKQGPMMHAIKVALDTGHMFPKG